MNKSVGENRALNKVLAKLVTLNPSIVKSIDITSFKFTIGRSQKQCDQWINDPRISLIHLEITYNNREFSIQDLSTNGTYLKGSKIGKGNKVILKNDDVITLLPNYKEPNRNLIIGFKFEMISNNQQPDQYDWLENEISCTICAEYMVESVTLNPCNHHFCGACLSKWMDKRKDCPTCRQTILGIMKAHTMNNFVEKFLKGNPEKLRSMEVLQKMKEENLIYKNPEKFGVLSRILTQKNDDEYEEEIVYQIPDYRQCKSCAGKEWKDYQCHADQVHVGCGSCGRLMPKRNLTDEDNQRLQMCCSICRAYHCEYYYGDCAGASSHKLMLVKALENHVLIPQNFINASEYNRLKKHLKKRPQSVIFKFMMNNYISKGLFYYQQNKFTTRNPLKEINVQITPESVSFFIMLAYLLVMPQDTLYVQCIKYHERLFMLENCELGVNCEEQLRDKDHAEKFNHCCEQSKFD